jgi:ribosomal-protein-alanine N-acetyltransferase
MEISTDRLLLRPYRLDDLDALHAFQSDAEALQYEPWGPHTREMVHAQLVSTIGLSHKITRRHLELAIERRSDGQVIGSCRLQLPKSSQAGWATLGYVLGRAYWGQGYATEAAQGLITYARAHGGVMGVRAISDSHNTASTRVLEKCGMDCVGMVAELELVKGRFRDMLKYELTSCSQASYLDLNP